MSVRKRSERRFSLGAAVMLAIVCFAMAAAGPATYHTKPVPATKAVMTTKAANPDDLPLSAVESQRMANEAKYRARKRLKEDL